MLSQAQITQLQAAIASTRKEFGISLSLSTAKSTLERVYERRKEETGKEFKELVECIIDARGAISIHHKRALAVAIMRYFQPRALEALAGQRGSKARTGTTASSKLSSRVVGKPTGYEVTLRSPIENATVTFRATKRHGRLAWEHVRNCGLHPAILRDEEHELRKQALAIMNERRRVPSSS